MDLSEQVLYCIRTLNDAGYLCYIVGGAVRNFLLGIPIHDYDCTTNATPTQMKEVFRNDRVFDTGIKHGTITVVIDHIPVEITTFRKESAYKDHRHPDSVCFASALKEDCQRRDFTINALCYHPEEGIIDYFSGQQDLHNRIIRCIGNPDTRFEEDALRILRAVRFSAQLEFSIDQDTAEALIRNKDMLKYISAERIHDELAAALSAKHCAVQIFHNLEIFSVFLPELNQLKAEAYDRTYAAMLISRPDACARMALLLYQPQEDDYLASAQTALRRLKYSNNDYHAIMTLLKHPKDALRTDIDKRHILQSAKDILPSYLIFRCALDTSLNYDQLWLDFDARINDCYTLDRLAIDGRDVKKFGIEGSDIKTVLNGALEEVIAERAENTKEALYLYLRQKADQR